MNNKQLFEALKDVEFCDMDTGCYYRMAGVYTEAGKRVVSIETVAKAGWRRGTSEWVKATEQLPVERGYYLACVKRTAPKELGGDSVSIKSMRWMGEDWRYAFHIPKWINEEVKDTVAYWMPLPTPPK